MTLLKTLTRVDIRKVGTEYLSELSDVVTQTFVEAFESDHSIENIDKYLKKDLSDGKLRKELSKSASAYYLAETSEGVSGYMKINWGKAQTEIGAVESLEIERIYVVEGVSRPGNRSETIGEGS